MKPDDFDKDLRDLAGGFRLPVQNDLFAEMMQARKNKRRRAIALYFGGLAAAILTTVLMLIYYKADAPDTTLNTSKQLNYEERQQDSKILPLSTRTKKGTAKIIHNNTSETEQPEEPGYTAQREQNKNVAGGLKEKATTGVFNNSTPKNKQPEKAERFAQKERNNKQGGKHEAVSEIKEERAPGRTNTLSFIKEQAKQEMPAASIGKPLAATVAGTPLVKTPTTDSVIVQNTLPASDSGGDSLLSIDSVAPVFASGEQTKIKEKTTRHIEAGIYAHYFAITNAVNSSSLVPFNKPDSFGLNEKASYASSVGFKGTYRFNQTWGITLGIGINKLQFDKIRIAKAKVDSLKWYELTNSGAKDMQSYNQSITEQSFTWLEIPVGISYMTPLSSRISFCTEIGVVYQSLLQNKAYEFTSSGSELSYKEMNDIGYERLNKNLFSVYLQPGISTSISKRFSLFTGLSYRHQFTSYYKEDYFQRGPFYFLGATANFTYKF